MWFCCKNELNERTALAAGSTIDAILTRAGGLGRFQFSVLVVIFIIQCFCATVVMFPSYVPIVADFIERDTITTSYMSSSFFAGQLLAFPVWGLLCDRIGRVQTTFASCLSVTGVRIRNPHLYSSTLPTAGAREATTCPTLPERPLVSQVALLSVLLFRQAHPRQLAPLPLLQLPVHFLPTAQPCGPVLRRRMDRSAVVRC